MRWLFIYCRNCRENFTMPNDSGGAEIELFSRKLLESHGPVSLIHAHCVQYHIYIYFHVQIIIVSGCLFNCTVLYTLIFYRGRKNSVTLYSNCNLICTLFHFLLSKCRHWWNRGREKGKRYKQILLCTVQRYTDINSQRDGDIECQKYRLQVEPKFAWGPL